MRGTETNISLKECDKWKLKLLMKNLSKFETRKPLGEVNKVLENRRGKNGKKINVIFDGFFLAAIVFIFTFLFRINLILLCRGA